MPKNRYHTGQHFSRWWGPGGKEPRLILNDLIKMHTFPRWSPTFNTTGPPGEKTTWDIEKCFLQFKGPVGGKPCFYILPCICAHTQGEAAGIWIAVCSFWLLIWLLIIRYEAQDGVSIMISGVGTTAILFPVQSSLQPYGWLLSVSCWRIEPCGQESPSLGFSGKKALSSSAPLGLMALIWSLKEGLTDPRLPLVPPDSKEAAPG